MRERDAPRGAQQQLHAQALFQPVQAAAHDGGGHALGIGRGGQAAAGGHRHKGFELLEFVHTAPVLGQLEPLGKIQHQNGL